MDAGDVFIAILVVIGIIFAIVMSVIFVPLSIEKNKAEIELYHAASRGEATGVIIQFGNKK